MKLALPSSGLRLSTHRVARTARSHGRTSTVVRALLGPYQYKTRVARLRQRGIQMHEFGERVLQQGSYGDDVMQLQAYLAEQGFLSSADGLSGYFGEATREALQTWQRDQALRITGVFSDDSKWAYVRQQEAAMQAAQTEALVATVASAPPPLPVTLVQAQPALATGLLGAAAVAAGVALAGPRLMGRDGLAAKAGVQLLKGARWSAAALLGMTVAASRVLYGAASGAVKGAVRAAVPPAREQQPTARPAGAAAPRRRAAPAPAVAQADYAAVAPAELAARLAALEEEEAVAEEAAYRAAVAAAAPTPAPQKARKLSDEEVQQRIAVMKGEVSPRTPVPQQRPAPRPLPIDRSKPAGDPITGSKYGTYYGGQQVREKVKQYLEVDTGIPHSGRINSASSRRMESMGYQMSTRPRPRPSKPAAAAAPHAPQAQAVVAPSRVLTEAEMQQREAEAELERQAEPFRDVVEAVVVESAPKQLLSGTELEAAPEKRGRPVPVVKPGMASPLQLQPGSGAPQAATVASPQAPPRPVPVVKPQKRATIGDMLRSAVRSGDGQGGDPYAEPYSLVNGGGSNGSSSTMSGGGSGYKQPDAAPRDGASGSGFPVATGSSYAAAAGGGSGGGQQGEAEETPVTYNPDGSVVLASKPIKLVKPAHLLTKTYGFEQMGTPLPEQAAQQVQQQMMAGEGHYQEAELAQQAQQAQGDDVMFGGYRRRSSY